MNGLFPSVYFSLYVEYRPSLDLNLVVVALFNFWTFLYLRSPQRPRPLRYLHLLVNSKIYLTFFNGWHFATFYLEFLIAPHDETANLDVLGKS
jgi:hypothetical protein